MRIQKPLLFVCACVITFCLSCYFPSKDVRCPDFRLYYNESNALTVWFPYRDHDTLRFIADGTGATQTFTFDTLLLSNDPEVISRKKKTGCSAMQQGESVERGANGLPAFSFRLIKRGYFSEGEKYEMSMNLLGLELSSTDVREDEFRQITSPVKNTYIQKLNKIIIAGKSFYDVTQIRLDTLGAVKPPVHKVYFAERIGLLAFETYSPSQLWIRYW